MISNITKEFFENHPLYKKLEIEIANSRSYMSYISKPAINMECAFCNSTQTFNIVNQYNETTSGNYQFWGHTLRAVYRCSSCNKYDYFFFLEFVKTKEKRRSGTDYDIGYVRKVGQNPPWEIKTDKNTGDLLGDHAAYYKKGLVCESQSYGIGAFAYFRRMTEEIIDQLLQQIEDLIPEKDREKYHEALEKTVLTHQTTDKIELVKDLLPDVLKPNGINPLEVLHSTLSEGLHSKNDEQCLEYADNIKKSLIFLVNQVIRSKAAGKEFTDGIQSLLEKKRQKIAEIKSESQPSKKEIR